MKTHLTVCGFGDSITLATRQPEETKWLGILGRLLRREHPGRTFTMINAGVGGNTSREGLARLDRDVIVHRPDIVLVQFGGNDATCDQARHVDLPEYERNLECMCSRFESIGARTVLLTFPPVVNAWHAWSQHPSYATWGGPDGCVEIYRNATRAYAQASARPLVDLDAALRQRFEDAGPATFILPDGVHLTASGNLVVAEAVRPVLARMCEAQKQGAQQPSAPEPWTRT